MIDSELIIRLSAAGMATLVVIALILANALGKQKLNRGLLIISGGVVMVGFGVGALGMAVMGDVVSFIVGGIIFLIFVGAVW